MTLWDYVFILCSFHFDSFHSIPLHSTLFVVFGWKKCAKKSWQYSRTSVGKVLSHRLTKRFSAGYYVSEASSKTKLYISLNQVTTTFRCWWSATSYFFIGFKLNKKMHFFLNWSRVFLGARIYDCESLGKQQQHIQKLIHSIGPTSSYRRHIPPSSS